MRYPPCPKCGSEFFGSTFCNCGRLLKCHCHGPTVYDESRGCYIAQRECDFTWTPKEAEEELNEEIKD